MHNPTVCVIS